MFYHDTRYRGLTKKRDYFVLRIVTSEVHVLIRSATNLAQIDPVLFSTYLVNRTLFKTTIKNKLEPFIHRLVL